MVKHSAISHNLTINITRSTLSVAATKEIGHDMDIIFSPIKLCQSIIMSLYSSHVHHMHMIII